MEFLVYFIVSPFILNHELFSILIIMLNIPVVLMVIAKFQKKFAIVLFLGFFIRIVFVLWDIYGRNIFSLPHSGGDTEFFLSTGVKIANNLSLLSETLYGGMYSKLLGILFFVVSEERIIAQYINVLLGLTTIILVLKILKELNISTKIQMLSLILMTFLPHALIFSSILLREALVAFLVTFSFYFFTKWFKLNKIVYFLWAIIILLAAASFHSGVLGVIVGYIFMLTFYNYNQKKLIASLKSVVVFSIFITLMLLMNFIPLENVPFFDKFTQYAESTEDIYNIASGNESGGSSYLTGLTINSTIELILYAPIKMIYFITSPLPWDWRGALDIVSFLFDGILYLFLILYPLLTYRKFVKADPLTLGLFITLVSTILIFGVGIDNSGTALRHRYKIFYLSVIFFVLVHSNKTYKINSQKKKRFQKKSL